MIIIAETELQTFTRRFLAAMELETQQAGERPTMCILPDHEWHQLRGIASCFISYPLLVNHKAEFMGVTCYHSHTAKEIVFGAHHVGC